VPLPVLGVGQLIGYNRDGALDYAGKVGKGFIMKSALALTDKYSWANLPVEVRRILNPRGYFLPPNASRASQRMLFSDRFGCVFFCRVF
jgi:hypothetical protein